MSQLVPIAAALAPALPLLAAAYLFQPGSVNGPRHRAETVKPVAADWTPLDGRVRAATRHWATRTREAGLTTGGTA